MAGLPAIQSEKRTNSQAHEESPPRRLAGEIVRRWVTTPDVKVQKIGLGKAKKTQVAEDEEDYEESDQSMIPMIRGVPDARERKETRKKGKRNP